MEKTMKMLKIAFVSICLMTIAASYINAQPRPTRPTRPDAKTDDQRAQSREGMMTGAKAVENLIKKPFIFTKGELQVTGDDVTKREAFVAAIAKSDAVIQEYQDEVNKFLASNPSPNIYANEVKIAQARAKGFDADFRLTEKELKTGNSLGGVYYLQKLHLYKGFLQGVTKIYPNDSILQDYLKKATEAIESFGTREAFMDKMFANQKEQAKNLRMVPAAMSNPKIEAMVKTGYETSFKEFKVVKVNITNNPWILEKNELGIPLYKRSSVSIGVKNAKGECGIGSANVRQDYEGGGSYGAAYMYLPSDPIIVPCENIK